MAIELSDRFASEVEAKKAADEFFADLREVQNYREVEWEVTHSTALGGETFNQTIEALLRDQCDRFAADLGITELWKESQTWRPSFQRAWSAWRAAWDNWVGGSRRFPETKGPASTQYLWKQKQFLAALRIGRGNKPEFYRNNAWLLWCAARQGDVNFFRRFAQAQRRTVNERNVQFRLMTAWMPAALWSCNQDVVAKFMRDKANAWGLLQGKDGSTDKGPPGNPGEAVRRAWQLLRLWHDEDYRITDFDSNWQPVFRR